MFKHDINTSYFPKYAANLIQDHVSINSLLDVIVNKTYKGADPSRELQDFESIAENDLQCTVVRMIEFLEEQSTLLSQKRHRSIDDIYQRKGKIRSSFYSLDNFDRKDILFDSKFETSVHQRYRDYQKKKLVRLEDECAVCGNSYIDDAYLTCTVLS